MNFFVSLIRKFPSSTAKMKEKKFHEIHFIYICYSFLEKSLAGYVKRNSFSNDGLLGKGCIMFGAQCRWNILN